MNRLLFSILLILASTNIYAQNSTSIELVTKDGRAVILKPDGTWEFKKVAPQSSAAPAANSGKPNETTNSLPVNFVGSDVDALFRRLLKLEIGRKKSEFETTAQYENRIKEEIQKPLIGDLTIQDTFFLVTPDVTAKYNADTQKMQFFLSIRKSGFDGSYRIGEFRTKYSTKYNVRFNDINNFVLAKGEYSDGFSNEISLNVEDAKRLKETIKAVVLVKLEEPYIESYDTLLVRLIDAYFFDPETGKILAKLSEAKK